MSAPKSPPDPMSRLGTGTVVLIFTATWCVPGMLLAQVGVDLAGEYDADIRVVDIDIWPQHAEQFRVISVPTVVKLTGKAERKRLIGAMGRAELQRLL